MNGSCRIVPENGVAGGQAFLPVQKERGKGKEGMAFILS